MTNRQIILEDTDRVENLNYHPVEKKYINVMLINKCIIYILLLLLPLFALFFEEFDNRIPIILTTDIIVLLIAVTDLAMTKKACTFKGYAIREKDITYRRGIIYHRTTTMPFCKIQQVSISQSPVARIFGLYCVDITNGAQLESGLSIPGLNEKDAEDLKELITEKIQHAE